MPAPIAYKPREDGLTDVHFDNGTIVPMPLKPGDVPEPPPPPPAPSGMVASNDAFGGKFDRFSPQGGGFSRNAPMVSDVQAPNPLAQAAAQVGSIPDGSPSPQLQRAAAAFGTEKEIPKLPAAKPELAAHRGRAPTEQDAQGGAAPADDESAIRDRLLAESMRGSGGGGRPPQLGLKSQKLTFDKPGAVNPADVKTFTEAQQERQEEERYALEQGYLGQKILDVTQQKNILEQRNAIEDEKELRRRRDNKLANLEKAANDRQQEAANIPAPTMAAFWQDQGIFARIQAAIAVLAGGFVQGFGHHETNQGAEMVNKNIDRWISLQKDKYERARGSATSANNAYKEALDLYGSPEAAEADMKSRGHAVVQAMYQNAIQRLGTEQAYQNGKIGILASKEEQAKANLQGQAARTQHVEQEYSMQGGGGGGGGGLLGALKKTAEGLKAYRDIRGGGNPEAVKEARSRQVKVDGKIGWVSSDKAQQVVQGQVDALSHVRNMLREFETIAADTSIGDVAKKNKLLGLKSRIGPAMSVAQLQGAMSDDERASVGDAIGNPENFMHGDVENRLSGSLDFFDSKLSGIVENNVYADPDATQPYSAPDTAPPTTFKPVGAD